ncbi:fimbrial protein [Pseudomonas sp. SWRI74]|uniref:Fimbrial protein n=1 Tax=Pseudomonas azerbaijanoccidentalis TaxID=2842347 RepID=A0ABS6QMG9_9PSED|nr:CS1 type fimbrial major subunit [Pseudomonas azerbaijanoccidentalis]MBV4520133.1 fimbrial protein [Pseudomonas azerbaijanoccidentalis]
MFKKIMTLVSMVALTLGSVCAYALVERETFEVSITIPTAEFYVLPVDPDWIGREQKLTWDLNAQELSSLRKQFDVKNSNGEITARLSEVPYLSNGRHVDNIALDVQFNRVKLSVLDAPVISEMDGKTGKRVELVIAAVKPDDGYKPGEYYGSVHMIFEASAP